VSTSRIQLWTGGQHRVKLGTYTRDAESIKAEGLNRKAFWSTSKRSLAIMVGLAPEIPLPSPSCTAGERVCKGRSGENS
jgi:hypothetical protein